MPLDTWLAAMHADAQGGYAFDLEENAPGIQCVAVPIRDASGKTVAAVSVTGTADSTDEARLRALIPTVRGVAKAIGAKLGGTLG